MNLGKSQKHLWNLQMEIDQSRMYLGQTENQKTLISLYMIFEATKVGPFWYQTTKSAKSKKHEKIENKPDLSQVHYSYCNSC